MSAEPMKPSVLKVADWPEPDRSGWARALAPRRGPFRHRGGGRSSSPFTIKKYAEGYGRWLAYLATIDSLACDDPADRVTLAQLDEYFEHLVACGNGDHTILGRFIELARALELLYPGRSFAWILKPGGAPMRARLEMRRRTRPYVSSADLMAWAEELFRAGLLARKDRVRRAMVRDAVMIAILAARAPRLRALASLRLGVHILKRGDEWFLLQTPDISKTKRELELPLPAEIARLLERYIDVERRELAGKAELDALWVRSGGCQLDYKTITGRMHCRSKAKFGVPIGPHAARRSLATTIALESPECPLDGAALLGHSTPQTTLRHYNMASGIAAAKRHGQLLRNLRANLAPVAK